MTTAELARALNGIELNTSGKGFWTDKKRRVRIKKATSYTHSKNECHWLDEDEDFLQVYFSRDTWDPNEDGLIYTDPRWIKELREVAKELGFERWKKLNYTEQGMQGNEYVHLIVGVW